MLRNISNQTIELKWGGKEVSLNPDDYCDVEVSFNADLLLEDRFISKLAGKLEKFTPEIVEPFMDCVEKPLKRKDRTKKR